MAWTEMRPRLWLTKWVVTYANMTEPEANRSCRITLSTRAYVSRPSPRAELVSRVRRLLAEGVSAQTLP